jgi:uncharacterized membrane protein YoaK (UPF0700 family)
MNRLDGRVRLFAACLSALAGYVDALAFLNLGGFFVSFMSGNSTRLGVGLAEWSSHAAIASGLVSCFVGGVFVGSLVGSAFHRRRRVAVLSLVTLLLVGAAALGALSITPAAVAFMALAMGAENAVFEENGDVRIGLTYMTGALVKVGQRLALAATGGDRFSWAPFLLLWAGLVSGATLGAVTYRWLELGGLWIAAAGGALLVVWGRRLTAREEAQQH